MFVKPIERETARRLHRNEGRSIREIAAILGVSVSSVSRWTADITLSAEFTEALRQRNPAVNGRLRGVHMQSVAKRAVRLGHQAHGRDLARCPTRLHLAGCMLHWAEGSKKRNRVTLTNSDPDLVALFVRFLRECHGVPPDKITLSVNCHLSTTVSSSPRSRPGGCRVWDSPLRPCGRQPSIASRAHRAGVATCSSTGW